MYHSSRHGFWDRSYLINSQILFIWTYHCQWSFEAKAWSTSRYSITYNALNRKFDIFLLSTSCSPSIRFHKNFSILSLYWRPQIQEINSYQYIHFPDTPQIQNISYRQRHVASVIRLSRPSRQWQAASNNHIYISDHRTRQSR